MATVRRSRIHAKINVSSGAKRKAPVEDAAEHCEYCFLLLFSFINASYFCSASQIARESSATDVVDRDAE